MGSRTHPRYKNLRFALETQIRNGTLAPGQQLPSTSALMKLHGVSDGTVKRAVRELIQEGLIFAINGKGTFVSQATPASSHRAESAGLLYDPKQSEFLGGLHYAPVLQGIEEELTRARLSLELVNGALLSLPELVQARRQGGFRVLIVAAQLAPEQMAELAGAGMATVSLFHEYAPTNRLHSLIPDDLAGVRSAASHFLDVGCRRMGALVTHEDHGFEAGRLRAFQSVWSELYGAWDDSYAASGRATCEGGQEALRELLSRHPEVDAVLAANGLMAVGAIEAAKDRQRKVPDSLKVIGYDDLGYAHRLSRTLSVLRTDRRHLGRRAVEILTENLRQPDPGFTLERIQPQLVISDSTRPVRAMAG